MKRSSKPENNAGSRPIWKARSTVGAFVVALLVAGYSLIAPAISRQIGIDLPTLTADRDGGVRVSEGVSSKTSSEIATTVGPENSSTSGERSETPKFSPTKPDANASKTRHDEVADADDGLLYGRLREISPDRFMSISGLLYTPGSAEGHRLEHLRRHTVDQPGRAGSHGVFDGDMDGAIETIDLAYERAKKGQRTTQTTDQGRTIYTIDMGQRIGFIGGRNGKQKRNPMARRVRLIVEGNRVITAYPL